MRPLIEIAVILVAVILVWNQPGQEHARRLFPSGVPMPGSSKISSAVRSYPHGPAEVALVEVTRIPLIVNGQTSGSATLPAGTILPVVSADAETVRVRYANAVVAIAKKSTDLAGEISAAAPPQPVKIPAAPAPTVTPRDNSWMWKQTNMDKPSPTNAHPKH